MKLGDTMKMLENIAANANFKDFMDKVQTAQGKRWLEIEDAYGLKHRLELSKIVGYSQSVIDPNGSNVDATILIYESGLKIQIPVQYDTILQAINSEQK